MPTRVDEILATELPMRVRSNHALEHATLHILQQRGVKAQLGGISDIGGFWIYGEVETDVVFEAAQEALKRLTAGESGLAIHPNCGTNIVVSSLAAGGMAWMGMLGTRGKVGRAIRRLPGAILLAIIGYQLARPLGPKLQEQITTNADVSGLKIFEVYKHEVLGHTIHRISTHMAR
ncbi:MAG: hypothetical protein J7L66_04770 [Anaerolineaceae bacterium]|nr:hypothetical protein [Anaerolineaceae bacterium]